MSTFERVGEFHAKFGLPMLSKPDFPEQERTDLRLSLIEEELEELYTAIAQRDIVAVADALGDLDYVVNGMAHEYGIQLDECVTEIHDSNMSKLGPDGEPIYREDGKVLKGPNFREPDLESVLNRRS